MFGKECLARRFGVAAAAPYVVIERTVGAPAALRDTCSLRTTNLLDDVLAHKSRTPFIGKSIGNKVSSGPTAIHCQHLTRHKASLW